MTHYASHDEYHQMLNTELTKLLDSSPSALSCLLEELTNILRKRLDLPTDRELTNEEAAAYSSSHDILPVFVCFELRQMLKKVGMIIMLQKMQELGESLPSDFNPNLN